MINLHKISESFNARSSTVSELCETFIPNVFYESLSSPNNVIMVGPRGSGKTTLMRMLDVASLDVWRKEEANVFRRNIAYSGVFIPTDRLWKTQFDIFSELVDEKSRVKELLDSVFIYHVICQFSQTVCHRASRTRQDGNLFRSVSINKQTEIELVNELGEIWHVSPKIKTLRSLSIEVAKKKQLISDVVSRAALGDTSDESQETILCVKGQLSEVLGLSVKIVNTFFEENDGKWAFLFDELELAPEPIVQMLIDSMRGGPENLIFKLALSPFHKGVAITSNTNSAMKDQDVSFINLTGIGEFLGYKFAYELCQNVFNRAGLEHEVESYFEVPKKISEEEVFKSLLQKDPSFVEYIKRKEININSSESYSESDGRPKIRKFKFIAAIRDYYLKSKGHRKPRRRAPDYYAGFKNICKSTEYNPRMLIGLMNSYITIIRDNGPKKVNVPDQLAQISDYAISFRAMLSTIAVDSRDGEVNNIYELIDKVGNYFHEELHGKEFKDEPKGSLTFKSEFSNDFIEAIGYALNAGALIMEENSSPSVNDMVDIKHSRCRLSHLFSSQFGLLLNLQRAIDLSLVIKGSDVKVVDPSLEYRNEIRKAKKRNEGGNSSQMELL